MTLRIEIDMDNAAFEDNGYQYEVASILERVPRVFDDGPRINLRDSNGNTVGFAEVSE